MNATLSLKAGVLADSTAMRACLGLLVLGLAVYGMVRRYRLGHRLEVLAVVYTTFFFVLGFGFGARAMVGIAPRFVFPLVALYVPYAAVAILWLTSSVWSRLRPTKRGAQPSATPKACSSLRRQPRANGEASMDSVREPRVPVRPAVLAPSEVRPATVAMRGRRASACR